MQPGYADTIGEWMEDLRKGKADVLESGHSLILGWSDKILPIVDQLCNANASEGGRPIVILAVASAKGLLNSAWLKHITPAPVTVTHSTESTVSKKFAH